ncbi:MULTISPECIES: TIGR03943 family putative permease subunit [Niallia]|jgi:putative membrane protein|uniref:TIGR03943 family protein n=1 Tax=Niallia circulans TaxID=1397 RepID=A0AA91TV99_NIACI|nr:TIGR03943 family protein [Niallia circulans]AYV70539.1 TIGR03943 family protein [Niallia circulans]NRG27722.1 TIGR03943 family protein [Niallia circulans]PAD84675.1 TIGR03943 family protein [Niallia circulans]QJX62527.1 TIGR03943 family protein [Niallia circulans]
MVKIKWSPTWQLANELQGIVLIGFSLLIFKLLVTGDVGQLVAPKMVPLLGITMTLMFLLGFFRLLNSNLKGADCDCDVCDENASFLNLTFSYLLFFSPLMLFFTLQDMSIDKSMLPNIQFEQGQTFSVSEGQLKTSEKEDMITIEDDNYLQTMDMIHTNLDDMAGKEVMITGFIHREESFSDNQAVIARYVMTHCIADLGLFGYMLEGEVGGLQSDQWYVITGKLDKKEYEGQIMPIIKLEKAEETIAPDEDYIYSLD